LPIKIYDINGQRIYFGEHALNMEELRKNHLIC